MAKYLVLRTSYINDRLVKAGETVEYSGKAGANLRRIKPDKPEKQEDSVGEPPPDVE